MKVVQIAFLLAVAAMTSTGAHGQDYPNRTIKIVAPLPPGSAPDLVARLIGQKLTERLDQAVVIENRPGANGSIGGQQVARAPSDGYTLLLPQDSLIVVNPHVYPKMGWSPMKDLVPVGVIASNQFYLAINPSIPAKTLPEFVAHVRKAKPPLNYGSAGFGSQSHLAMEMLKERAGFELVHVPYRGSTPAATGTMTGEVQATFSGGAVAPLIQSGKLRPIAVAGKQRTREFPNVPTIDETYPGFEITIWFALFAPTGTPDAVLKTLRRELKAIVSDSDTQEKLRALSGMLPYVATPEEFTAVLRRDFDKYGKVVKSLGLKLDE